MTKVKHLFTIFLTDFGLDFSLGSSSIFLHFSKKEQNYFNAVKSSFPGHYEFNASISEDDLLEMLARLRGAAEDFKLAPSGFKINFTINKNSFKIKTIFEKDDVFDIILNDKKISFSIDPMEFEKGFASLLSSEAISVKNIKAKEDDYFTVLESF